MMADVSAIDRDAAGISRGAEQMRQYLRWVAPATLVAAPTIGALAFYYPIPLMIVLALGTFGVGLMQVVAYGLAGRDRVEAAVVAQAIGVWLITLGLGLAGKNLLAVQVVVAAVPVLIAIPHVSTGLMLRMSLGMVGVVAFAGFFVVAGPALPLDVPRDTFLLIVGLAVPLNVAVCGVGLWYTRFTLDEASSELEEANRGLRESEEKLERMVEKRSAELERSRLVLSRTRDEAMAANRHKSAFLANMSHELRTPLNAIIGFSEVLGEKVFGELAEKQSEYVHDIHGSGHHLLSLINDILDLSKIEADRLELALAPFELATTLENAAVALHERLKQRGVDLQNDWPSELGRIVADERRLRQVLDNLLSNAVKYTGQGGTVTICARGFEDRVEVAVVDTGIGIAKEDQAVVFEAFGKAGEAARDYSHAHEGAGVGLALTQRLVELHGGRLWVESELGKGSTFRFSLPRTGPDPIPAASAAAEA
jgi:signal transduction histidine kinase